MVAMAAATAAKPVQQRFPLNTLTGRQGAARRLPTSTPIANPSGAMIPNMAMVRPRAQSVRFMLPYPFPMTDLAPVTVDFGKQPRQWPGVRHANIPTRPGIAEVNYLTKPAKRNGVHVLGVSFPRLDYGGVFSATRSACDFLHGGQHR